MRTVAIIVNWNGGEDNLDCLASLEQQVPRLDVILFVDNASGDGSPERVAERFPGVEILRNDTNLGYGGGNNRGIARALELGADVVMIVNNDVVVPQGALQPMLEALAEPGVGVVGPRVLMRSDPGRVWAAGGALTWRQNLTTLRGHMEADGEIWRETVDVDYLTGCCMLVRREVFDAVGAFDAAYFAYTEDVDFCLRAARAGFCSRVVGSVAALHAPSSATGGGYNPRRKYMMGVNSIWFLRSYATPVQWAKFALFDVATLPIVWLVGLFKGRGKAVAAKGLGIFDGLRGRHVTAEVIQNDSAWLW